jgi:hypothetical protein
MRLAVLLVAALALAGCYKVRGSLVERNDDKIAATFVGQYYQFKDLPEPKDWTTLKDEWATAFEIKRDAQSGQYQVVGRSSEGAPTKPMTARIAALDDATMLGQVSFATGEIFVFLLRRDANGIVRTARGADGKYPQLPAGDAARQMGILRTLAASKAMVWAPLLVPRTLVDK